ncbi:hypothetical protein BgiMline_022951, partial [Biomphalaria glabrata]
FDQSAITLIMVKMYGDDIYRFIVPDTKFSIRFRREHQANYFNKHKCSHSQLYVAHSPITSCERLYLVRRCSGTTDSLVK